MRLSIQKKLKSLCYVTTGATVAFFGICIWKEDEKFYKNFVMPCVHLLDPEKAHNLAVFVSQYRLIPKSSYTDPNVLNVKVFGKYFTNPIGIAAGFDKDGKAILGLKDIGFGFVEVGSVTPLAQPGNEKPRVFRLKEDLAIINRYGFNSEGHEEVLHRVENVKNSLENSIVGVNLGKNKTSQDSAADYVQGVKKFGPVSDYLVINISSPNTPNLRALQNKENLRNLLKSIIEARNNLGSTNKPPILLKIAPDLTSQEKKDIADIIKQKDCKVDGLIVCNTTVCRDNLKSSNREETGGLSGKPLKDISTDLIAEFYRLTDGMPIIGVGGISTGLDAYEKIKAGAVLVQIYSAMTYEGPTVVKKIKKELAGLLIQDGHRNLMEAVGKDSKKW